MTPVRNAHFATASMDNCPDAAAETGDPYTRHLMGAALAARHAAEHKASVSFGPYVTTGFSLLELANGSSSLLIEASSLG